ncbi:MAG: hypothetical protein IKU68_05785 [Oscillospiraceae bacterium]|nr:hypothetical protein [Oscillospiraceae bacterium]
MCRRKQLQGWCAVCFGLGLMVGSFLESWFICSMGGACLVVLGLSLTKRH